MLLWKNIFSYFYILLTLNIFDSLPFGTFNLCRSFSQDANVACRASVIFLFVPGVRGGGTNCPPVLFVLLPFIADGV